MPPQQAQSVMGAAIFFIKPNCQCWIWPQATAASPGVVRGLGAVVGGRQALLGRILAPLAAYGHSEHGGRQDQDGASTRQYVIPVGGHGWH